MEKKQKPSTTRHLSLGGTLTRSRAVGWGFAAVVAVAAVAALMGSRPSRSDPRHEAEQYIRWSHTIALTPDQEAVKQEALGAMPAPCCSSFSMATCCCPCNLAKAAWGLAAHDIAHRGYDAIAVRQDVERWLASVNPRGAAGDACEQGRCALPFDEDGCGGMNEEHVS